MVVGGESGEERWREMEEVRGFSLGLFILYCISGYVSVLCGLGIV